MSRPRERNQPRLKISAVARLTGVSVHTLRKWETRYAAVAPERTEGGERVYTQTDLERLRLIRRLADAGLSLRDVAALPLEQLAAAWGQVTEAGSTVQGGAAGPVRVAVLGSGVAAWLAREARPGGPLDVVAAADTLPELEQALDGTRFDVLIYECPAVRSATRRALRDAMHRLAAPAAVVVYRVSASADLLALRSPAVATLRGPADLRSFEQSVGALVCAGRPDRPRQQPTAHALPADADVPPPRLSREMIARLVRSVPKMRCECPHHLAELALSLRAFEEYSADCESLSPEEASLHHDLWLITARARALIEDAIERVAVAEGISLTEQ